MSRWAALFDSLPVDTVASVDTVEPGTACQPHCVNRVNSVNAREDGKKGADEPRLTATRGRERQAEEAAESLARDTAARARAATAPPADPEEAAFAAAERAAIQAEGQYPMPALAEHGALVAGLLRAARGEQEPPELATLSPSCTEAVTARPDGRVELRRRLPAGRWSAPVPVRVEAERWRAA